MKRDRLRETASALTYQTILALVPLLAILLGIAKGFSLDTNLVNILKDTFSDHATVIQYLLNSSRTALEQTKSGVIAGCGILFFLFTTMNLLGTTENIMNRMWGVIKDRSVLRRIADFQSFLFLFPLLVVIGSSTTIFIQTMVNGWSDAKKIGFFVEPVILYAVRLLPLISLWAVFSLCYWMIPYVHIKRCTALITAFFVTLFFHFLQSWYIYFQVTLTKTSVIYGSFAALPLFLVWVWISWFLFLTGAELLVFFHEKGWRHAPLPPIDREGFELYLTATLFHDIVHRYRQGKVCVISDYVRFHNTSFYTMSSIVHQLDKRNLVYLFSEENKEVQLIPTQKGLSCSLGDILLPSSDSLPALEKETLERWKKMLHE